MKAVILAAGEGKRMRPLTENTPKPMLPLLGRPILEHLLEILPEAVDEVILVVGYRAEKIKAHFSDRFGRFRIHYIHQEKPEGTAREEFQRFEHVEEVLAVTVVEVLADEKGLVWPASISPMRVHLLALGSDEKTKNLAQEIYKTLEVEGIDVLFDDRDVRAGEKFADADLIGITTRVILGDKTLADGTLEIKDRATGETKEMTLTHLITELKK